MTRADDLRIRPKKPSETSSVNAVTEPSGEDSLPRPAARKGLMRRKPSARGVSANRAAARAAARPKERASPPRQSERPLHGRPPAAKSQAPPRAAYARNSRKYHRLIVRPEVRRKASSDTRN